MYAVSVVNDVLKYLQIFSNISLFFFFNVKIWIDDACKHPPNCHFIIYAQSNFVFDVNVYT